MNSPGQVNHNSNSADTNFFFLVNIIHGDGFTGMIFQTSGEFPIPDRKEDYDKLRNHRIPGLFCNQSLADTKVESLHPEQCYVII